MVIGGYSARKPRIYNQIPRAFEHPGVTTSPVFAPLVSRNKVLLKFYDLGDSGTAQRSQGNAPYIRVGLSGNTS